MNEKEIAEIRRRLRPEYNNIGRIRGCFVNENHTIISEFDQNPSVISSDESEEILSLLRRTLSGGLGRNLIDISFTTQQVSSSDEHALLNTLRTSSLSDEESVKIFFQKAIESIDIEGSYFLFLANDKYDVFSKDENGEKADSNEVFSYRIGFSGILLEFELSGYGDFDEFTELSIDNNLYNFVKEAEKAPSRRWVTAYPKNALKIY